jgi:ABC-type amino acid transport substrate-binding protein
MRAFVMSLLLPVLVLCSGQLRSSELQPAVFMTADVWPWGYLDETGRPAGLISELALRLGSLAGLPVENRVVPHQRLLRELRHGRTTFAVLFDNPLLNDHTENLGAVLHTNLLLMALETAPLQLSLEGLGAKRVGYIRGTYYGQAFEDDQKVIKVAVSDVDQGLRMLMLGRLDAIIISEIVLHHTLNALAIDPKRFAYSVHLQNNPGNLYMFHQPSDPSQGQRLRRALEQMRASGELERMFHVPSFATLD